MFHAFRLLPGQDLYDSVIAEACKNGPASHAVVTCVGSLTKCRMRLAGATATNQNIVEIEGPLEIVSLVGTVAVNKAHLHISVADKDAKVYGGHLLSGSPIETTGETVIVNLKATDGITLTREPDATTGFSELVVHKTE